MAESAPTERSERQAPKSVRILLVGGADGDAESLRAMLTESVSMSFEVSHGHRLAAALDHPDTKAADLVVLDTSGSSDGLDVLTQLRLRLPRLPVVVIDDRDDELFATRVLRMGARAYLGRAELNTRLLVTTVNSALESHRTIMQLNATRERAHHLASHDQLTGLPNRTLFAERLEQAVNAARRGRSKLAVLYIDLDGFKAINDSLGHAVGDGLLRGIARHLTESLGESDSAARLGGDEFCVLLTQLSSEKDAEIIAERILYAIGKPPQSSAFAATHASIGIAMFPKDSSEPDDLVNKADRAMYNAKESGRNRFVFYESGMDDSILRSSVLECGLRNAVADGGLVLHYQPQFDLRRQRIVGSEALVRWNRPEFGQLSPGDFLPLAEETGLIVGIGEWVMRNACLQNAYWQDLGYRGLRVSVNVASQQFQESGFVDNVASCLEDSGMRPEGLEIEITESSLLEDVEATLNTLHELRRLGIRLAIDDFGTGYSALCYLKRLPIDVLKIDQSFVQSLATDTSDATIVQAIIQMAHGLNLTTIAEGVENLDQLLLLGSYGCRRMQGYLFGRPVPAKTFERWLIHPPFKWKK